MKLNATLIMVAILALAGLASAQGPTTGTITVTGSIPERVSVTTDNSGTALSATVTLGALEPAANQTLVTTDAGHGGPIVLRLRSNKAYKLSAQATALSTNLGSVDGGTSMTLGDIGFGIRATTLIGGNVANSGARGDSITAGFDYTGGWPAAAGGLTPSWKSLNDITSSTQILNGTRISKLGNMTTTDNYISVTIGVGTLPQYFTPDTGFSTTVTLTIATN